MTYLTADGFLCNEGGGRQDPGTPVSAGRFVYHSSDAETLAPRTGPRFKFKSRPPHAGDDQASTMSNSKRSSINQSNLLLALVGRDFCCVISEAEYPGCTASHILPLSRPEYYAEVLGYEPSYLFEPSYGLLLRDDLHHAFDKGHIAFYPSMESGNELIVHVLNPEVSSWRAYHGKIIRSAQRFRGEVRDYPNTQMLLFHYQQCAIKCLRGWSAF